MSNRKNNGTHSERHRQAAELHNLAAHAHHAAAEQHGKQDHLTGQEFSRKALEHSEHANLHADGMNSAMKHEQTASLAHKFWESRGCPEGTPDEDWFRANNQIQSVQKPRFTL